MIRTLLITVLLAFCLNAENAKERQLALDKSGLVQDKVILTQTVAQLKQQVSALLTTNEGLKRQAAQVPTLQAQIDLLKAHALQAQVENRRLQTELAARPAVVVLPPAAQATLNKTTEQLKATDQHVIDGNAKAATAATAARKAEKAASTSRSVGVLFGVGTLILLGFGFYFVLELLVKWRTRDAADQITRLTKELADSNAAQATLRESLHSLVIINKKDLAPSAD